MFEPYRLVYGSIKKSLGVAPGSVVEALQAIEPNRLVLSRIEK